MLTPKPTYHAHLLMKALAERNVHSESEFFDGHKHIDVYIREINLFVEIDGLQHYTDPYQIISDLQRNYYSDQEGRLTFRITNQLIDSHLNEIADAIEKLVH